MSSLTSLSVNKSSTRFTPKVKARNARRITLHTAETALETESASQVGDQSGSEEEQVLKQNTSDAEPSISTSARGTSINVPTNQTKIQSLATEDDEIPFNTPSNDHTDRPEKKKGISISRPTSSKRANAATVATGKPKKRREMLTLNDIDYDPATEASENRPLFEFTTNLDVGIVSRTFKEYEERRKQQRIKGHMSRTELKEHLKREREEEEKRRKELAEEEENKRQAKPLLSESSNAVQVRLVNGEIVLDTDTLLIDRQGRNPQPSNELLEVVEEHEMSRRINSETYGKKSGNAKWSAEETEIFYDALSQYGTDFETISRMLPNRSRRQIKLKFRREEKQCPWKITEYLTTKRKPADLEQLQEITGQVFESVPEDFHIQKAA